MRVALMTGGLALLISVCGICPAADQSSANGQDLSHSASVEVSRLQQTWLAEAEDHLKAGQHAEAIIRLQNLLDAESTFLPQNQGFENSHQTARKLLETLPAAWLARYEEQFGGIAREKLKSAQREHDLAAIRRLANQYPLTQAGFEALRLSSIWHFDHGEFLPAAAGFRAISEHPFHRQAKHPGMLPADVLRWVFALSRLELSEEAQQVANQYQQELKGFETKLKGTVNRTAGEAGSGSRQETSATIPSSTILWEHRSSLPDAAEKILRPTREELTHRGLLAWSSFSPIAVGDLVIARSLAEVQAHDRTTGAVRWRAPTESQTVQLAQNQHMLANPRFRESISKQLAVAAFADRNAGTLTSDGSRVFVMLTDLAPDPLTSESPGQLMALDAASGTELWRVPSVLPNRDPAILQFSGWIRDHSPQPEPDVFFFGPPTPLGDSLYLVGEKDREIRLYQLASKTGEIEWSLRLATTDLPLRKDRGRRGLACPVVSSGGLLLCPTGAGMLAAVDPHSRTCRWVYRYLREDFPKVSPKAWPAGDSGLQGVWDRWWTGWRDVRVVTRKETVLLVSPESNHLHAVSLRDGQPLWNLPRGDGLFLADADNDHVLLIGSQTIRAIDPDAGEIVATISTPMPAGRGGIFSTQAGPQYLLPLQAGGVLRLDVARKTAERTFPTKPLPLENFLVKGETILSQTQDRILRLAPLEIESKPPADAASQWAWAKSQREAGRFREAVAMLKELASDGTRQEDSLPANLQTELRETLLMELAAHPERARALSAELEPLLDSAEHRIRGFQALAEAEQLAGDPLASLGYWLKLLEENPTGNVTCPDDPALEIAFSRYIQGAIANLLASVEPNVKPQLEAQLETYREKTLSLRDPFAVSRFARRFDQLQWGRELIVEERHRTGIGQTPLEQQLSLWMLTEEGGERSLQALAFRRLAEDRLAELRFREAAFFHRQLRDRFAEIKFPDGQTVSAFLERLPMDSPIRKLLNNPHPERKTPLRISEQPRKGRLPNLFHLPILAQPGSLCAELDVWLDPARRRLRFGGAGHPGFWELALPSEKAPLQNEGVFSQGWGVGPLLILRYGTDLLGIAPLDDHGEPRPRVLWRIRMAEQPNQDESWDHSIEYRVKQPPPGFGGPRVELHDAFEQTLAHVGPVSAGLLTYHSRGRLIAIEPATGKTLWSRSQLPPYATTIGHAGFVLLVSQDHSRVTVLRALDGRVVAHRELPPAGRLLDWWGQRALFQEAAQEQVAFSLWDAVTDRRIWSVETPPKTMGIRLDDRRWGCLTPDGELRILDGETGELLAKTKLKGLRNATQVHVTMDAEQFYLAVVHDSQKDAQPQPAIIEDLPHRHPVFEGTLLALDRQSGELSWQTKWARWAFPLEQPATGPVLVLFHREKAKPDRTLSIVRCLEKRTGREVYRAEYPAFRENPHWSGDPEQQGFELQTPDRSVRFQPQ